ncbi:hypothetical protein EJ03DRAFT_353232 [Teratosphaeria nubilosa]|uniref:Uncharacterized protein n=1 Tax=Teratosphaeria nubilosa TaxID=161662 RepID=A0A6G1L384_9PEZI|nr:hypothetical protein EJ03DRAFT_353232 [Teratosphaeria nubilosa]
MRKILACLPQLRLPPFPPQHTPLATTTEDEALKHYHALLTAYLPRPPTTNKNPASNKTSTPLSHLPLPDLHAHTRALSLEILRRHNGPGRNLAAYVQAADALPGLPLRRRGRRRGRWRRGRKKKRAMMKKRNEFRAALAMLNEAQLQAVAGVVRREIERRVPGVGLGQGGRKGSREAARVQAGWGGEVGGEEEEEKRADVDVEVVEMEWHKDLERFLGGVVMRLEGEGGGRRYGLGGSKVMSWLSKH